MLIAYQLGMDMETVPELEYANHKIVIIFYFPDKFCLSIIFQLFSRFSIHSVLFGCKLYPSFCQDNATGCPFDLSSGLEQAIYRGSTKDVAPKAYFEEHSICYSTGRKASKMNDNNKNAITW